MVLGYQVERPPAAEVAVVVRRGLQDGWMGGVAWVGVGVVGPDDERAAWGALELGERLVDLVWPVWRSAGPVSPTALPG